MDSSAIDKILMEASVSITRAFQKGVPFLQIGNEKSPIVLAFRNRGEVIDDPDCETAFEALQTGVFMRFEKIADGHSTYVYMRLGDNDPAIIRHALEQRVDVARDDEISSISADVAFQSHRWEEASRRREERRPAM